MAHVFISYAHADGNDYADIVQARLKKKGIESWLDDNLKAGDDWSPMIDDAIRSAYALILIVTPKAIASQYVIYEVGFAMGRGIPILPLNFANADITTLILPLSKLNIPSFLGYSRRIVDPL
ncbi:MAG: toll/interleukin-1 receptor domain-containing protein [Anaerolineae bacterium]|nr:toll/interleukin-1 receptor domain-containing protein [Anaerolineae bacterium]